MNSKKECKKYLAAFADGELDVDQNLRLLEHMKMDPNATARVAHQQQLREAQRQPSAGLHDGAVETVGRAQRSVLGNFAPLARAARSASTPRRARRQRRGRGR